LLGLTMATKSPEPLLLDTSAVIWGGDLVFITATQFASDRIPVSYEIPLILVLTSTWTLVAHLRGDIRYTKQQLEDRDSFSMMTGLSLYDAIQQTLLTWLIWAPVALGSWAAVLCQLHTAGLFVGDNSMMDGGRPPEDQVIVAILITVLCWRVFLRFFFVPDKKSN